MRYIDADKLCKGLKEMASVQCSDKQNTILGVVSTIENTPTADVVEVKHGEWIEAYVEYNWHATNYVYCSLCKETRPYGDQRIYNYCPKCGAKMDGGKEE